MGRKLKVVATIKKNVRYDMYKNVTTHVQNQVNDRK